MRADFDSPTEDNDWDDSESEVSDFNDDDDNTLLDFLRGADSCLKPVRQLALIPCCVSRGEQRKKTAIYRGCDCSTKSAKAGGAQYATPRVTYDEQFISQNSTRHV